METTKSIFITETGRKERYQLGCRFHNPDGPAIRNWNNAGRLIYEGYWLNGKPHRLDAPASREWNNAGKLVYEGYWLNGGFHNPYGPAIINYANDISGTFREHYYLNGTNLTKDDWRDQTKPPEILAIISRLHAPIARAIIQHYCRA